ncbi:hypothetical protein [uncultured Anaerococcus sp.]|uniref:hypothetical protein n=1 Tax=uncultured Anaerococcus sp. TaxID=293428 RepID=UPI00288B047B|nr:hypothetical protein [uncultured Anaerococcus sp.]
MKKRNVLALALAAGLVIGGTSYAEGSANPINGGAEVSEIAQPEANRVDNDELNSAEAPFAHRPEEKPEFKPEEAPFAGKEKTNGFSNAEAPFQNRDSDIKFKKAEDPFGTTKVKKAAPKTSKENNPHYFKSVAEAIAAYPDSKPMYENGKYIVFSDKAPLIGYEFNSVQEAADVFPNLTVEAKNGKYYVYTSQAPLLKYTFDTQAEAFEAFENIKPMYENGKYVIYTQEAPKVKYEFATAEEALKAFPGSTVEAKDGKYYVYTTMDPVEGTVAKKVVGNPTPLKRISSHSGEVISDNTAKENKKSSANEGSAKAKAPAKANKNVKTGVAGLTGVVATLAAASAALFKSKRR